MRAWIVGRTELTDTVITLHVRPEATVDFLAGQYIDVYVAHAPADQRGEHRWFTISSRPGEPFIDLTMRRPAGRLSSFKQRLLGLANGSEIGLGEVLGDFVAPINPAVPLVFVADGIGVTPFISIVRDLMQRRQQRSITLFHTVRQTADYLFDREFMAAGVNAYHKLDTPFRASEILGLTAGLNAPLYYLAGSEQCCLNMQSELLATGVPSRQIALDYFSGYLAA